MTQTDRGWNVPPLVACAKAREKGRANTMTMKERIKVHVQIERENRRKLEEFKKGGNAA